MGATLRHVLKIEVLRYIIYKCLLFILLDLLPGHDRQDENTTLLYCKCTFSAF